MKFDILWKCQIGSERATLGLGIRDVNLGVISIEIVSGFRTTAPVSSQGTETGRKGKPTRGGAARPPAAASAAWAGAEAQCRA